MIYTVTLNPSLDYTVWTDGFSSGAINRTKSEKIYPGGKGINVSVVLKNLGFESTALGFCAGFTGAEIKRLLAENNCVSEFIDVKNGLSRINVKIKSDKETEINGMGPKISDEELEALMEKTDRAAAGDFLVLAGSIPATLPKNLYCKILKRLEGKGVLAVVDAEGELLKSTLPCKPFLIKPNLSELEGIYGKKIQSEEEIAIAAMELKEMGAVNVLVSLAGDGALLLDEHGKLHRGCAHKGQLINSVGAGDSMVAGFIAGYTETGDYQKALELGLASGSASAFDEWLASKEDILKLYNLKKEKL